MSQHSYLSDPPRHFTSLSLTSFMYQLALMHNKPLKKNIDLKVFIISQKILWVGRAFVLSWANVTDRCWTYLCVYGLLGDLT